MKIITIENLLEAEELINRNKYKIHFIEKNLVLLFLYLFFLSTVQTGKTSLDNSNSKVPEA